MRPLSAYRSVGEDREKVFDVSNGVEGPNAFSWYPLCRYAMKTRIQKWGNSLALRIPKPFAEEAHLAEDSTVDVTVRNGRLVVVPMLEPEYTLEELVGGITPENCHSETDTGTPVGNEVW
jgi:antitoxin MazE